MNDNANIDDMEQFHDMNQITSLQNLPHLIEILQKSKAKRKQKTKQNKTKNKTKHKTKQNKGAVQ